MLKSTKYINKFDNKNTSKSFFDVVCPDLKIMDKDSRNFKLLGEGAYGKAFLVKNNTKNERDFKKIFETSKDVVVKKVKQAITPDCIKDIRYKALNGKTYNYEKAFLCMAKYPYTTAIPEYYISMYASKLIKHNVIDTYAIQHCSEDAYIFMEKVEGDLHDKDETEEVWAYMIIQILYALHKLHQDKILHCDPHSGNIFYTHIKNIPELKKSDYLLFDFTCDENKHLPEKSRKFYIPTSKIKYIVKLGDFGLASKFSKPYILNETMFQADFIDYFNPFYDLMVAFSSQMSPCHLYTQIKCFLKGMNPCYLVDPSTEVEKKMFVDYYKSFIDEYMSSKPYWKKFTEKNMKMEFSTTLSALDAYEYLQNSSESPDKLYSHVSNLRKYLIYYVSMIYYKDSNMEKTDKYRMNLNFDLKQLHHIDIKVTDIIKQVFFYEEIKNIVKFDVKKSEKIVKM